MQLCTFDKFNSKLKTFDERPLRSLSIELTRSCNFLCKHCYCVSPTTYNFRQQEQDADFWKSILSQSSEEGGLFLTITGGEPLTYPCFKEVWQHAKRKGFIISLFSNGALITPSIADFLAEWSPFEVSVTLYGASEQTYKRMTGQSGAMQRVINGLDLLRERNIKLEVKGIFHRLNKHEFHHVKSIALQYCEHFRWDAELMGALDQCSNTPQNYRLSPEEYVELEMADPVRANMLRSRVARSAVQKPPQIDGAFRCNIGNGGAHVDPYGQMHPCLPIGKFQYDLTSGSVRQGWREEIPRLLSQFTADPGPCQICSDAELCGQCFVFNTLEDSPATGPVPFRCELAKIRKSIQRSENSEIKIPVT